jgi:hypothetical protein
MPYSASLSNLLNMYPFEKCDDPDRLSGDYGIFLIIGCRPGSDGATECTLLDFGGAVDLGHAINSSIRTNNWLAAYGDALNVLVAKVSPMECETILRELRQLDDISGG